MILLEKVGEGKVIEIKSGETIFKLDSHESNPIVTPQDIGLTWKENDQWKIGAVFNGGAERIGHQIILLPRCHRNYRKGTFFDERLGIERICLENYISEVWPLISDDGIHFTRLNDNAIRGDGSEQKDFTYGIEDIRIVQYGERYILLGCGKIKPPFKSKNSDRIAIYSTTDFLHVTYQGMIESFDSRNAVLFPEPIDGKTYMLLRFHPNIHLVHLKGGIESLLHPFQHTDQWQKIYEQRRRTILLRAGVLSHEKEKIGPGTQLIKTEKGWLLIYHAVGEIEDHICEIYGLSKKIKRGYSICAALLDLQHPERILCRTKYPLYIPSKPYELYGDQDYPVDVPAVVFPVGAIVWKGRLLIYAGSGDKYMIFLSCHLERLIDYLCQHGSCIA